MKDAEKIKNIQKIKCHNCEYEWDYGGSRKFYASCPQCHYQVNIAKQSVSLPTKCEKEET